MTKRILGIVAISSFVVTSIFSATAQAAESGTRPSSSGMSVKVALVTGAVLAQNLGLDDGTFAMSPLSLAGRKMECASGEGLFPISSMTELSSQRQVSREGIGDTIKIESDGKTVALGKFSKSSLSKPVGPINDGMYNKLWNTCTLLGTVSGVPKRNFYTVYVNDDKVGDYTYSELKKGLALKYG